MDFPRYTLEMDRVEQRQVIITTILRRGITPKEQSDGKICRVITQVWTLDGNLIAEYDPYPSGYEQETQP